MSDVAGASHSDRRERISTWAGPARRRHIFRYAVWVLPLAALLLCAAVIGILKWMEPDPGDTLRIVTGTENRILWEDPNSNDLAIMERFEKEHNVDLVPTYQGSVDTMLDLQNGAQEYDAVWPASSIWLDLGNTQGVISRTQSIMTTPVVFAVKRSKAEELGWIGRDVYVDDILEAAESGQLDFLMSSASQSNSGAMAYLGFLSAFAGHPEVLTSEMLKDPTVADDVSRILGSVGRTAGSSGFLRDLMVENYADYDGMVNNESAVISANQQLIEQGESDLLYVIYPVDGLAIADWPMAFVDHGVEGRSALFEELQAYLLSDDVQQELLGQGRRTSQLGGTLDPARVDPDVFDPDWGIDVERVLDPFTLPAADVILEALTLYQSALRKPSFVVFCLDYSGSMDEKGKHELEQAMTTLLDQNEAATHFLQRTPGDTTVVLRFSDVVQGQLRVEGNDPTQLLRMLESIERTDANGGTNIYQCLAHAQTYLPGDLESYAPAVILMTDGKSNQGSFSDFEAALPNDPEQVVPVYAILFGDAERDQLEQIAKETNGAIYDGRDELVEAMRNAFANA